METQLESLIKRYHELGISQQLDYDKFYLYSLITHSTAIEGSTITELENQIMFDDGLSLKGKTIIEQMMNLDLRRAYEKMLTFATRKSPVTVERLKELASLTMSINKVPSKLEEFCQWLNEGRSRMETMSLQQRYNLSFDAHYELVTIHPWADGNGRMARLLMNWIQFESGLIPSKILKEDKEEYIKALVATRESGDKEIFRTFMTDIMVKNLSNEIDAYVDSMYKD